MPTAKRFEDLEIWNDARKAANITYKLTQGLRDYGLRDQMRRCAVSVMANIAEGFARGGNAEFVQFLYIAKGSAAELKSHLYIAFDCGYIKIDEIEELTTGMEAIINKLGGFINYLKKSGYKGIKYKKE